MKERGNGGLEEDGGEHTWTEHARGPVPDRMGADSQHRLIQVNNLSPKDLIRVFPMEVLRVCLSIENGVKVSPSGEEKRKQGEERVINTWLINASS